MNCQKVRKYLLAFADSQLSVQLNCEVLDHLKMCASCSTIVTEHQAVKQAIQKSAEKVAIPAGLEKRVCLAIQTGKPIRRREPQPRLLDNNSFLRIVALAACLTLAFTVAWQFLSDEPTSGVWLAPGGAGPRLTPSAETTQLVVRQHNLCDAKCERGEHHLASLPHNLDDLPEAIAEQYEGDLVAIAPDLTGYGFELDSASFCKLPGEEEVLTAHVMYVNLSFGTRFSIFSMPRWGRLDVNDDDIIPTLDNPFIKTHDQCTQMTVLAWHQDDMSYVCCGTMDARKLREIAQQVGIAMANPESHETLASAFAALNDR